MRSRSFRLADAFHPRRNSLNCIRLLLAFVVIVSHAWPLSGRNFEPSLSGESLGGWAVLGFFAISGFLITRSREGAPSIGRFFEARLLRIYPAFLVCIIVVAFVFAPLSTLASDEVYRPGSALAFVVRNLFLYPTLVAQDGIADTLRHVPYEDYWNGSLWTLFWEASCYAAVGLGRTLLNRRRFVSLVAVLGAAIAGVLVASSWMGLDLPRIADRTLPLFLAFAVGALIYYFRSQIPVSRVCIAVAIALLFIIAISRSGGALGVIPLSYILIAIGGLESRFSIPGRFDISYGVYIYGWPVAQLYMQFFGSGTSIVGFIVATMLVTSALATVSLVWIERPALAFKERRILSTRLTAN